MTRTRINHTRTFAVELVKACLQTPAIPKKLKGMPLHMEMLDGDDQLTIVHIALLPYEAPCGIQARVLLAERSGATWREGTCEVFPPKGDPRAPWVFEGQVMNNQLAAKLAMKYPDPENIRRAEVMMEKTVVVGDRVRHYGQRFTSRATATVTGFSIAEDMRDTEHPGRPWVKIHVDQDAPGSWHKDEWDWDRTVLVGED